MDLEREIELSRHVFSLEVAILMPVFCKYVIGSQDESVLIIITSGKISNIGWVKESGSPIYEPVRCA